MKKIQAFFFTLLTLFFLSGCDLSSDSDKKNTEEKSVIGELTTGYVIIGKPVSGLLYLTSSGLAGVTGSNGSYEYHVGDTVTFAVEDKFSMPAVTASKTITAETIGDAIKSDTTRQTATGLGAVALYSPTIGVLQAINLSSAIVIGSADSGSGSGSSYSFNLGSQTSSQDVSGIETKIKTLTENNSMTLPTADDTETEQKEAIADLVGGSADNVISKDDALNLNNLADRLADVIGDASDSDNLCVTVKFPEGKTGEVSVVYSLEELPEGVTEYDSGYTVPLSVSDSMTTLNFYEEMFKGNWTLNVYQFEDHSKAQVGDIFSYFHSDGFKPSVPEGYPLVIGDERVNLVVDLSTQGGVVETVYEVSGSYTIPKLLEDGTTDFKTASTAGDTEIDIFYTILDPKDSSNQDGVGSFHIQAELGDSNDWSETTVDGVECYEIPYTTALPEGLLLNAQLYLALYSEKIDWESITDVEDVPTPIATAIAFYSFETSLTAAVSDSNFVATSWEGSNSAE